MWQCMGRVVINDRHMKYRFQIVDLIDGRQLDACAYGN
jgi:hypothetical protein